MRKSNKVTKRILASIMSAAMIIGILTGAGISNTETVKAQDYGISNPRIGADGSVTWDKVKFGSYKQSVEFGEAEPIKWRILSVDENNNALLLADKGLDCKQYHEGVTKVDEDGDSYKDYSCTWETCTLRSWLNEEFYNEAFNESEQAAIKQVTVKNDDNPSYGTEGGNDTTDKVYLLSIEEASSSAYGFDSEFDTKSVARQCKVTDYARMNGASSYAGNGYWWLRSPGKGSNFAAEVNVDGWDHSNGVGRRVYYADHAIRPALQINLSSSLLKDAGEVASDGTVTDAGDGYNNPKVIDEGTVWDCVYFGRYKHNSISEKQPIEWRVLSVDGDEAFLLSDMGLDCKTYNEEYGNVAWETCTLRSWLNDDFYNKAFTEAEQATIKQVTVKNGDNPEYGTEGGNDTSDKVYLLSIEEAGNSAYGFDSTFNTKSAARECKVTDYAYLNGAGRSSSSGYAGTGDWWLRSPGLYVNYAAHVDDDGWGDYDGCNADHVGGNAIRPALRINLSSSAWEAAGTVSTGKGVVDPDQPTQTHKPTAEPSAKPTEAPTAEPSAKPTEAPTEAPTAEPSAKPTEIPTEAPTQQPTNSPTPTKTPAVSNTPAASATPAPLGTPDNNNPSGDSVAQLKTIKLSSVVCKKNSTKISGKVSVSGATVKIKVGGKAYKKAAVKGKKFTLKVAKLKKKTKVIIKVSKSGYKSLSQTYKVK